MYKECNIQLLISNRGVSGEDDPFDGIKLIGGYICKYDPYIQIATICNLYITDDSEIEIGNWVIQVQDNQWLCNTTCNRDLSQKNLKKVIATTDSSLNLPQIPKQFIKQYINEYNANHKIDKVFIEMINLKNIYITQSDLDDLNHTDYIKVSSKYGFEYVDDFFRAMNETLFLIDGYKVYWIEVQNHDIYQDFLRGEFLFEIIDFENDCQLKLSSANEISIKPVEEKMYSKEDIEKILENYRIYLDRFPSVLTSKLKLNNWIEKNLK